ncbi:pro-neuregulin-2, membrane-bound isoform-like isoform X4 [Carassius auratus]|uniref:Pro-neuregulin-2, membrane-bound isoform-like isoform X4 n=1 Tax=Carassius auratus TaxID=7957 RepID=A0A6P6M3F5_CARAU|nr:pro-neuregulin-2, membrane-bound isoform-like isoform X4 [Carassius auratus]XP_052392698.1 pro-neuregulin-2, membrane-bound isoform isoform X8 [Carassius gibelio]
MRRLDSVHLSMLLIGVSFACYSPSLNSLQDQAYRSAVVIEGKVQSAPQNVSAEPYSVNVKVLYVWPRNSGGLERDQLVTVGEFGSEAPCAKVKKNHKYIFFMDPTDEPLVFKASFAPLDTSAKNLKKDVGRILCEDCDAPPSLKRMKNPVLVDEGSRLILRCGASGKPTPQYKWYKDGAELKKSKEIKISRNGKKTSKVQISSAKLEDSGNYTCVAENSWGKENGTSTVHVQSITTTLSPGSGHARRCNESEKAYCVNGGDCYYIHGINRLSCKCPDGYFGKRCLQTEPLKLTMPDKKAEELYQKRVLTITGICVALLVVGIVCVVAYCKTKKQRKKMHNHLRQNIYVDHPNRNLANGPNHPGPGPEEIPMVDYISKNVPATERVIGHRAEAPFPGSRQSSRSHNSSTRAHSSTHRYVSALTTPARLSPVDFHYSLPPQVPTFQITSPNASHAMSLPPAAHAPYPPEEDQPLLRRYQVPLHEARGHEPYRQQQRGSYLRDNTGSLPSSPYRLAQEEVYESTQEYLSSMEQPKRSSRHWHRSRLNGHVAPRGYHPSRDLGSRSCLSDSEEEEGESTPFLSMQNMNAAEPVTLYRPVPDTQTSHAQSGRHGPRTNKQTRLTHTRSKLDNAPH